jgi:hypothetical protein
MIRALDILRPYVVVIGATGAALVSAQEWACLLVTAITTAAVIAMYAITHHRKALKS